MQAILMQRHGGPEAVEYGSAPDPQPGPGQAVICIEAMSSVAGQFAGYADQPPARVLSSSITGQLPDSRR